MQHSPLFLKLRLAMFSLTTLICLLWVILLSCVLFTRWDVSSQSERTFLILFLGIDALTMIILPVLLLAKFRTWLDGARLLFLLVCHIGTALSFAVWLPTISCPDDTPDDHGICQLLNVYIVISSWVPPLLLILYGVCLALYTWRVASRPREPPQTDGEVGAIEPSLCDIPTDGPGEPSLPVVRQSLSEDLLSSITGTGSRDSRRGSRPKSRLEKRLPEHLF
ncbi:hypothetical protein EDB84DRAFT_1458731 [Lactarius hengduanensis]|nr:hypothetical protein EDB84DRAFT_1458731 [Lactarius hengduanensis]